MSAIKSGDQILALEPETRVEIQNYLRELIQTGHRRPVHI